MNSAVRESIVYSLGAGAAFAGDISLLWLLVDELGIHYLPAAAMSFLAGTVLVYVSSVRYAVPYRRVEDRRLEFWYFTAIGAGGIVLNLALMYTLVEWVSAHYLIAKIGSAGASFVANYGVRRAFLFTQRRPARHQRTATTEPGR